MSTNLILILAVGILTILMLLIAAIVVIWRRGPDVVPNQPNLSPVEEQKVMTYMNDGVGELYAGLIILMFGVSLLSNSIWMAGVFVAIFTPLFVASKRNYTAPRLQFLNSEQAKRGGFGGMMIVFLLLGVLTLIIGVLLFGLLQSDIGGWLRTLLTDYGWALAGGSAAALWAIAAYITETARFYGYAVLSFVVLSIGLLTGIPLPLLVAILGGTVLAYGLIILNRFLQKYPLSSAS